MTSVSLGGYLVGVAFFVPTVAAAVVAAIIVLRGPYDYLSGMPRFLAGTLLASGMFILSHLVPAALGVLARGTVLASAVIVLGVTRLLAGQQAGRDRDAPGKPPVSHPISILIAAMALVALGAYELARLRHLLPAPITDVDMINFHLPGVARFIQTGTLWQVTQFLPGFATAQYPNNGDLLLLASVLPWHDLAFARVPGIIYFVVTGLAVYGMALELRATRAAATTFAAAALAVFQISHFALEGLPDSVALSTLTVGALFLVRHARTDRAGELALGGLGVGLALGTKWYGLTAAAVVGLVWLAAGLARRRGSRALVRQTGLLLGMMAVGGGFWLVRNLVESGNPLYPKAIRVLGLTLFPGSRGDVIDQYGYSIAHYLFRPHVLYHYIYPGFRSQLGLTGLVLLAGLIVAVGWSIRHRRDWRGWPLMALVVLVGGIFVTYVITPGTAYGPAGQPVEGFVTLRWLMPAVVLGAAITAAAASTGRWGVLLEAAGLAGVLWSLSHAAEVSLAATLAYAAGLAAVALLVWGVRLVIRDRRVPGARTGALAVTVVAAVAVVMVGRADQTRFDGHGYAGFDPVFAWIDRHAPSGRLVALAGSTGGVPGIGPALPSFGPRLGNQVVLVGRRVVHSVALPPNISAFRQELLARRYSLLVIGLPYAGGTDRWARQLGLPPLARSHLIALYGIPAQIR